MGLPRYTCRLCNEGKPRTKGQMRQHFRTHHPTCIPLHCTLNPVHFIAVAILHFSDGGDSLMQVLGYGNKADCASIVDSTHGVSYSGTRPVSSAEATILAANEWPELLNAR